MVEYPYPPQAVETIFSLLNPFILIGFSRTSAHYATSVRCWLNENFTDRWLGSRGPVEWPTRSCDLALTDFFLWAFLKNKVYASKPHYTGDLMSRITAAIREVPVDLCQKVCKSVASRLREYKDNEVLKYFSNYSDYIS
jgi:hypothetical protein